MSAEHIPHWISEHLPPEVIGSNLFKFKIKLSSGVAVDVDLMSDIEISYEHLEQQLDECPAQYVFWSSVYSEAKESVSILERRIKVRRGALVEQATAIAAKDTLRLTEKQIAYIIEKDDILNEWEVTLAVLQKKAGKLYHMVQAVMMKSEHLRSRAGFKKEEMRRTPS